MQNADGGWGAYDRDNNKFFFNRIPFSDMEAMCDPSVADITARIIEAFALVMKHNSHDKPLVPKDMGGAMLFAADRAIKYLSTEQESNGAWFGRWGVNYIYGTSNVVCGLAEMKSAGHLNNASIGECMQKGVDWLLSIQNEAGGWGESLDTSLTPRSRYISPCSSRY